MRKYVLITGVKGGIGKVIAKTFRDNDFIVVGADINVGNCNFCDQYINIDLNKYCISFTYRKKINNSFSKILPRLDVLINNAAVQKLSSLENIQLKDWTESLNVNLTAPMLLSQYFLKELKKSKGSIINIASIHHNLTKKQFISYATSKGGLVTLTKSMSVDLEGQVRVNSISPAAVDTAMLRAGFSNNHKKIIRLNKIHPIQRIGKPDEIAKLALLLTQDELGFINGANINIDGGISNVLKDL